MLRQISKNLLLKLFKFHCWTNERYNGNSIVCHYDFAKFAKTCDYSDGNSIVRESSKFGKNRIGDPIFFPYTINLKFHIRVKNFSHYPLNVYQG